MILSIITNFYIVRKMSIIDYGYVSLALSIVSTAAVFVYQWSGSTILYVRNEKNVGSLNEVIWSRNIILSITLLPTLILTLVFRGRINQYLSENLTGLLFILLVSMMLSDYYTNYLLAKKQQITSSLLGISIRIVLLLLSVFLLKDIKTFLIINIISNIVFVAFLGCAEIQDFFPLRFSLNTFKRSTSFSLWQAVGIISLSCSQSIASIIISNVTTIEEVSYYNVAFKVISAIVAFESYIPLFFAPLLVDYYRNSQSSKLKHYFYKSRPKLLILGLISHMLVFITSDWFIPLLFGNEYYNSILVFKLLIVYSFFYLLIIFYSQYANVTYKYKLLQIINIVSAVVTILAAIILTPHYGAMGYALANSVGLIVKFLALICFMEPQIAKDCHLGR